ncbi:hypothetical protein K2224_17680 [Streptomyces sp. BHT-5-2]|uniref:hypothetical protein n=1 Tax=unclassified Streptomyces TaxID=2593676 RepID=UPI001C8D61EE|nr:hypothetical protein [Streptomyces sp. BHT-5-2]QZL04751.1 hypothetical protein K2224_17680 [Streptomyces sp. BHT-5-2]
MADITKISAQITTADVRAAGTDGWVYLGIAGREFVLSSGGDDFETGSEFTYILGDDSNVAEAEVNDPRRPELDTDDLDRYPAYIRLEPEGTTPEWCLERVTVTVNPDSAVPHRFDNPRLVGPGEERRIWLSQQGGKQLYLKRYEG